MTTTMTWASRGTEALAGLPAVEMRSAAIPSHRAQDAWGAEFDRGIGFSSEGTRRARAHRWWIEGGQLSSFIYYLKSNIFANFRKVMVWR